MLPFGSICLLCKYADTALLALQSSWDYQAIGRRVVSKHVGLDIRRDQCADGVIVRDPGREWQIPHWPPPVDGIWSRDHAPCIIMWTTKCRRHLLHFLVWQCSTSHFYWLVDFIKYTEIQEHYLHCITWNELHIIFLEVFDSVRPREIDGDITATWWYVNLTSGCNIMHIQCFENINLKRHNQAKILKKNP